MSEEIKYDRSRCFGSAATDVEKYPLDRVVEAYGQMHSGKVRFRFVLAFNEQRIGDAFCS